MSRVVKPTERIGKESLILPKMFFSERRTRGCFEENAKSEYVGCFEKKAGNDGGELSSEIAGKKTLQAGGQND